MDTSVDRNSPKCGKVSHILEHWFDCHGTVQAKLEIFGTKPLPLHTLLMFPGKAFTLARHTL